MTKRTETAFSPNFAERTQAPGIMYAFAPVILCRSRGGQAELFKRFAQKDDSELVGILEIVHSIEGGRLKLAQAQQLMQSAGINEKEIELLIKSCRDRNHESWNLNDEAIEDLIAYFQLANKIFPPPST